jgi:glucose/arabinose dehydrogenase
MQRHRRDTRLISLLLLAGALGSGCSNDDSSVGPAPPVPPPPPHAFATTPASVAGLTWERAWPSLSFAQPIRIVPHPDGGRFVVAEQGGLVRVFDDDPLATAAPVLLDLSAEVIFGGEMGLLGLCFAPDAAQSRVFYVCYTAPSPLRTVLARYRLMAGDPGRADPASREILLEVAQPFTNHNGGQVLFGPDGMLWLALGDGGSGNDPLRQAQDPTSLLGKLLRLDPSRTSPGLAYAIPRDNPFVGQAGWREEIWALGLRNPWRFSFDRATGEVWVGDVGQNAVEEIDVLQAGDNAGWPFYEGERQNEAGAPPRANFRFPRHSYGHDQGPCVIGGIVYRGTRLPALAGCYLFGDCGAGTLSVLAADGSAVLGTVALPVPVSIDEDADGEPIVVSFDGLFRAVAASGGATAVPPATLSATGLFADTAALVPAPWLSEYDVNAPSWKDGAASRRFAYAHARPAAPAGDGYAWPTGSVLVKHFEIEVAGAPSPRRLETRVLVQTANGFVPYTYQWNAAGTDADLVTVRTQLPLSVPDPLAPGGVRAQTYEIPADTDCRSCHQAAAGFVLGVNPAQLQRQVQRSGSTVAQLDWLVARGVLESAAPPPAVLVDPYAEPDDTLAARAWLHTNCAHCHRPGAAVPVDLDLLFSTAAAAMRALDVDPTAGTLGIPGARRVAPGDRSRSVLWARIQALGPVHMPPLSTQLLDAAGIERVGRWIDGL